MEKLKPGWFPALEWNGVTLPAEAWSDDLEDLLDDLPNELIAQRVRDRAYKSTPRDMLQNAAMGFLETAGTSSNLQPITDSSVHPDYDLMDRLNEVLRTDCVHTMQMALLVEATLELLDMTNAILPNDMEVLHKFGILQEKCDLLYRVPRSSGAKAAQKIREYVQSVASEEMELLRDKDAKEEAEYASFCAKVKEYADGLVGLWRYDDV